MKESNTDRGYDLIITASWGANSCLYQKRVPDRQEGRIDEGILQKIETQLWRGKREKGPRCAQKTFASKGSRKGLAATEVNLVKTIAASNTLTKQARIPVRMFLPATYDRNLILIFCCLHFLLMC